MASDQLTGAQIKIYAVNPSGDKVKLFEGVNEQTGPGGSPEGVQTTVKDNELPFMGTNPRILTGGTKIVLYGQMKTAGGSDASDCIFNVPIKRNGACEYLSIADFGFTVDIPAASGASIEHQLGTGYTIPQNDVVQIGGGKYFMSWEDDA